jgi:hypothetical protein
MSDEMKDNRWKVPLLGDLGVNFGGERMSDKTIDRLTERADTIQELVSACKALLRCIDDGLLVRNIAKDHESGWAMKQIPLVQAIQSTLDAIAKAEGRH